MGFHGGTTFLGLFSFPFETLVISAEYPLWAYDVAPGCLTGLDHVEMIIRPEAPADLCRLLLEGDLDYRDIVRLVGP